jgi:tRNA(His) guanylyltransferase
MRIEMKNDEFGDRMKAYEAIEAQRRLDPFKPICARIDGRRFSKFTAGFKKPFDSDLTRAMQETCRRLVEETDARIGYVQSDEISLIWLTRDEQGSLLFDARAQKLASVAAALATSFFTFALIQKHQDLLAERTPVFDARVWQVPDKTEAANTILWRVQDAKKNSVSAACRSIARPSEMKGLDQTAMRKLMLDRGLDYDAAIQPVEKFGTLFQRRKEMRKLDDETWDKIPLSHRPEARIVSRSRVVNLEPVYFGDVENRTQVIFDSEQYKMAA